MKWCRKQVEKGWRAREKFKATIISLDWLNLGFNTNISLKWLCDFQEDRLDGSPFIYK